MMTSWLPMLAVVWFGMTGGCDWSLFFPVFLSCTSRLSLTSVLEEMPMSSLKTWSFCAGACVCCCWTAGYRTGCHPLPTLLMKSLMLLLSPYLSSWVFCWNFCLYCWAFFFLFLSVRAVFEVLLFCSCFFLIGNERPLLLLFFLLSDDGTHSFLSLGSLITPILP